MQPTIYKPTTYLPISQELLDDAEAMERGMIRGVQPTMSAARVDYWMARGGWTAFASFKMRLIMQDRLRRFVVGEAADLGIEER